MDAITEQIVALASALIERPSITPEDADCQGILSSALAAQGFTITALPSAKVKNFWASVGSGSPVVVFAGHTDVVPTGPADQWRFPPFAPTIAEGQLYGRGSADMKGSLAAMVLATERFRVRHPSHPGTIAYLITSDEEGVATDGTVKVVDWLEAEGIKPEFCIVGEPSSSDRVGDVIRVGRRGSLNGTLTVRGIQGHVAYPDQARNPIHQALGVLTALSEMRWDEGNEDFPPTSFQISNITAGTGASNVIPGELKVSFNLRFSTEQTTRGLTERIETLFDQHALDYQIDWELSGDPFRTATPALINAVRDSIRAVQGFDPVGSTGGGTSDGRFIARLGSPIVELGPVNRTIHSVDEHTDISELRKLSDIYLGILKQLVAPQDE